MDSRINVFRDFANYIEYPMVLFEAETGDVLDVNYEAEVLIGKDVKKIKIEPGRASTKFDFWNMLRTKKCIVWHRIRMMVDDNTHLVSGLINETTIDDKLVYSVLFELRADMNIGSLTLERIVNHARIVAMHVSIDENMERHVEYASQNINQYGYSRVQLFDKGMKVEELVCPDDLEALQDEMANDFRKHVEENAIECRLVTEERELVPVRLYFHYNYDDTGRITDYEVLAFDRSDELRRNDENQYLSNAMFKMKSVVLVKSYHAGKRTLKYISPNAGMLGMNVEALQKGYRLTEDYIHPEDRDEVIDHIYQAVANGIADYEHVYRMVRDDGKQIWVDNQVTVNRISDGEAEISFLLTDISEQKEMEKEISDMANEKAHAGQADNRGGDGIVSDTFSNGAVSNELQLMADSLGKHAGYYVTAVDCEGAFIINPAGPADNLGIFYDLFERPEFKGRLTEIFEQTKLQLIPKVLDIELDGMPVHMVFSPLMAGEEVRAFWVLTSISGGGMDQLRDAVETQWHLANAIMESYRAKDRINEEIKNRKLIELRLDREKQDRRTTRELLDIATRDGEAGLGEMCQKMSLYLSVSFIGIYIENSEEHHAEKYFAWNHKGEDTSFFDRIELSQQEMETLSRHFDKHKNVTMAKGEPEPFLRELLSKTQMSIISINTMVPGFSQRGYVVFADKVRDEAFDKKEQHFIDTAVKIIQSVAFRNKTVIHTDMLREGFLETFDHIRDAVFVRNNSTGEILFANKAMDKLFGYSIVGMQSQDIINNQMEQYRMIQGMRKRFIANNKVTKWQSYMKELDQIMNVVEISLNIFSDADLSMVILKKNKNK